MKADVVIGAGYGDEGKGLMTDYLASQYEESIVIRFNGGAQAGHTVQTPDGHKHVFSHFSSGSLVGSHTYLSQFFILNPMVFMSEGLMLKSVPLVTIHPDAIVTTPYDMFINQMGQRGNTCGLGINETVLRNAAGFELTAQLLKNWSPTDLKSALMLIRDGYARPRIEALGLKMDARQLHVFESEGLIDNWMRDAYAMLDHCTVGKLRPKTNYSIIFEGAQGLLLDNEYDVEFGTPSNTGLKNVLQIAVELGIDDLSVNYMTRAYMTRHGDGPFPTHNSNMRYEDITNSPNQFQGKLRFGMFDLNQVNEAIYNDTSDLRVSPRLVVTHLDQMPQYVEYKSGENVYVEERSKFAEKMASFMSIDLHGESWGPTRKDVRIV